MTLEIERENVRLAIDEYHTEAIRYLDLIDRYSEAAINAAMKTQVNIAVAKTEELAERVKALEQHLAANQNQTTAGFILDLALIALPPAIGHLAQFGMRRGYQAIMRNRKTVLETSHALDEVNKDWRKLNISETHIETMKRIESKFLFSPSKVRQFEPVQVADHVTFWLAWLNDEFQAYADKALEATGNKPMTLPSTASRNAGPYSEPQDVISYPETKFENQVIAYITRQKRVEDNNKKIRLVQREKFWNNEKVLRNMTQSIESDLAELRTVDMNRWGPIYEQYFEAVLYIYIFGKPKTWASAYLSQPEEKSPRPGYIQPHKARPYATEKYQRPALLCPDVPFNERAGAVEAITLTYDTIFYKVTLDYLLDRFKGDGQDETFLKQATREKNKALGGNICNYGLYQKRPHFRYDVMGDQWRASGSPGFSEIPRPESPVFSAHSLDYTIYDYATSLLILWFQNLEFRLTDAEKGLLGELATIPKKGEKGLPEDLKSLQRKF